MNGSPIESVTSSNLHNSATVHDADSMTHISHYTKVVTDKYICHVAFLLQVQHEVENLRLD